MRSWNSLSFSFFLFYERTGERIGGKCLWRVYPIHTRDEVDQCEGTTPVRGGESGRDAKREKNEKRHKEGQVRLSPSKKGNASRPYPYPSCCLFSLLPILIRYNRRDISISTITYLYLTSHNPGEESYIVEGKRLGGVVVFFRKCRCVGGWM